MIFLSPVFLSRDILFLSRDTPKILCAVAYAYFLKFFKFISLNLGLDKIVNVLFFFLGSEEIDVWEHVWGFVSVMPDT